MKQNSALFIRKRNTVNIIPVYNVALNKTLTIFGGFQKIILNKHVSNVKETKKKYKNVI